MKVGTLCYATTQGLGYLAKSFYDAGVVTHPYVVIHSNPSRPCNRDTWYPGAPASKLGQLNLREIRRHMQSVDVMLFFETPFSWALSPQAKAMGVKTVLMPMYECMPRTFMAEPDVIINPSLLDQQYYPRGQFIPIPVESEFKWKLRERARVFVFNAGHGGLKGRNGTAEVLTALPLIKSGANIIIRSQEPIVTKEEVDLLFDSKVGGGELLILGGYTCPRDELYSEGDVFLFPEKFNGLSLPLQESFASGMLVMAGARFPNTTYLPPEPLIPVARYERESVGGNCNFYDKAVFDPATIAEAIDYWFDRDITEFSERGRVYAEENSWERLKPKYLEVLSNAARS